MAVTNKHRKILGETIRACRKSASMSQEVLAERAELHPNYVGEIERGEKAASIDTIVKIAKALSIPPKELFRDL